MIGNLNVLSLLPKTRKSNRLSKLLRPVFESKKLKGLIGAQLALGVVLTGNLEVNASSNFTLEPEILSTPITTMTEMSGFREPFKGRITQGFHTFHPGIDLGSPVGTKIRPVKKGKVISIETSRVGYGNNIIVEHEKGFSSRYAHMAKIEVELGQEVENYTVLGTIGMTGRTTGPHLHLEIRKDGIALNPKHLIMFSE